MSFDKNILLAWLFSVCFIYNIISQDSQKKDSVDYQKDSIIFYLEASANNSNTIFDKLLYARKAYGMSSGITDDSLKIASILNLAYVNYENEDFDRYKEFSHIGLKIASGIEDSLGIANASRYLGNYYNIGGVLDSAYYYYNQAHKIYKNKKDYFRTGRMLLKMAIIQKNASDFVGSEISSIEALGYLIPLEKNRYLSSTYNNLGIVSNELGNYEAAIENHKKSLEYKQKLKNRFAELSSLNNIGVVYEELGNHDKAIEYYNRALAYKDIKSSVPSTYARLLDNLTYSKFLKNNNDDSLLYNFYKSLRIRDSIDDTAGLIVNNLHLAEYYLTKKDTLKAVQHAKEAKNLAISYNNSGDMLKPLELLSKIDSSKNALKYAQQYIVISDSLQKEERIKKNQFARIRFETDEIKQENLEITQENIKISRQKELLTGITAFLAVVGILVYIIIKQQSRNKELKFNQIQQESNEEIYNLMISQQRKLEEGRQQEKQRVSQELHDGVLSKLFGTRLSLDSLNLRGDKESVKTRGRYLEDLKQIEQEIRQISHDLNAEIFDTSLGYTEVIANLIQNQTKVTGVEYQFKSDETINWEAVANKVKIHFYRILQESLQNINKHAKASEVQVNFVRVNDRIQLSIHDDGVGFDQQRVKNGIGLKNIKSRIKELNGKLSFTSSKGNGTNINISVAV